MKSLFFNAEPTQDLGTHPTGYDREYDADDHAEFFAPFFDTAGVMAGRDTNACKVTVERGNTLRIAPGCCYVKGRMCRFDGEETITVEADCRICARMNKTADVRAFQLVAVRELVQTEDIYDLELASVAITPVIGGYEAVVTDTRTFLAFMGQPAYYPPTADDLPYVLWLYTLGFPMTGEQRAMVEADPSLMAVFHGSLGAARASAVAFTAADWTASGTGHALTIPRSQHGRQHSRFAYTLKHNVNGTLKTNTWGARCTNVAYDEATGAIALWTETPYAGEIVLTG